nr:phage regulatory CII family protein [Luteimonas sp. XNQY3]
MAPRLGMSDATLRGKVNPNTDRNRLALEEADEMMGKTGDFRILHAMAAMHGHVAIRVDAPEAGCLISSLLAAGKAKGGVSGLVSDAISDGQMTPNEAAEIVRACMDAIQALSAVAQHARAKSARAPA